MAFSYPERSGICRWPLTEDELAVEEGTLEQMDVESSTRLILQQAVEALLAYFSGEFDIIAVIPSGWQEKQDMAEKGIYGDTLDYSW
jgi:hypothetical protein